MRNTIFILLALLFVHQVIFSQNDPEIDYTGELAKSVEIPQSPEAAAFEKYGNVNVSMYSGTPNISVPIYTIKGKEMDLPVSLSYDASGVKVEQLASQVGLGWNLNVGGRISRVVNGLPDNYSIGDYATIFKDGALYATQVKDKLLAYSANHIDFTSLTEGNAYLYFIDKINTNEIDAEPDYYSINLPGINDHIVFDLQTMQPRTLNNPRIEVSKVLTNGSITNWIVTGEDGTKYYFDLYERTKTEGAPLTMSSGIFKEYASSWVVTKIESPNKKDTYEFEYTNFDYWQQPTPVAAQSVSNTLNLATVNGVKSYAGANVEANFNPIYKIRQLYLTKIKHNGRETLTFELGSRYDIDIASALKSITIKDFGLQPIKKYEFYESYFGISPSTDPANKQEYEIRLKLDSIQIKGKDLNRYASYQFEYFSPEQVTDRQSMGRDYLGYANGKENNTVLYPRVTVGDLTFLGADRTIDFSKAVRGTLQKIIYPTGGSTTFEYELNEASLPPPSTTVDVTYQNQILSVGSSVVSTPDCGVCCQDKYGANAPQVTYKNFQITDAGTYDISFTVNGTANGEMEAYILTRPNSTIITYDNSTNTTFCTSDNALWQNSSGQPEETNRFFAAGYYQFTLVNNVPNTSLSLRVHRLETQTTNINTLMAGLRIKKITDDPGLGQNPIEKTYQYTTTINGSISSGKRIYDPKLFYGTSQDIYFPERGDTETIYTLNRVANALGGSQPHIGYSKVFEIEQSNGYIEHDFTTGTSGIVSLPGPPFSNSYRSEFKVAKEYQANTYNQTNTLLTEDKKEYYNSFIHSQLGFAITHDDTRLYKFPYFEKLNNTTYRLGYVDASWDHLSSVILGTEGTTPMPVLPSNFCNDPNITCIGNIKLSPLQPVLTLASGKTGNILKNEVNTYYTNGTTNQVVDYIYDTNGLLKETQTTNSDGTNYKTIKYYPGDFTANTVYEDMYNDHRLNTVIKTESYANGIKTGTHQTAYKKWGVNIYLPEILQATKDNLPLEDRIQYHSYYTNGNIKEVSLKNGPKTVYLWGYDETLPVAKIENATYAEIDALTCVLNFDLGSSGLSTVQESCLRDNLPNALITTYDYIPRIGVSKITDPRGEVIKYHYDALNRLEYMTDKNDKIVAKNEYNYKN